MLNSDIEMPYSNHELKGVESGFNRLFVTSAIGMAILDVEGKFLSANNALCKILGYTDTELRKIRCEELLNSFGRGKSLGFLRSFSKADTTAGWQTERTFLRKDRSLIPARIWINLLERSSIWGSLSLLIIEDITEQKEAEQKLNKKSVEVEILASQLIQSQEEERKRLARELHDDIGQRLSLIASEVALMASQHSDDVSISGRRLINLRDDLDGLCSDIHCMSHDLHSYKLEHLGLKSALKDVCRRLSQPGFHIDLDVDDMEDPASKEVSLCLYRVVQEALNNALRHAHTPVVAVTLTKMHGMVYMTIQDTGVGFEEGVTTHQGLGLISMTERLKLVKGELKLHSILGHGTEIWVSVPDEEERCMPTSEDYCLDNALEQFEVA